jgi:hypothetical protein
MNYGDQVTQQALSILRSGQPFQWYVIALMALVVYVYFNEAANRNWKVIAAGLALYVVHWFYEILNALTPALAAAAAAQAQVFSTSAAMRCGPSRPAQPSCC